MQRDTTETQRKDSRASQEWENCISLPCLHRLISSFFIHSLLPDSFIYLQTAVPFSESIAQFPSPELPNLWVSLQVPGRVNLIEFARIKCLSLSHSVARDREAGKMREGRRKFWGIYTHWIISLSLSLKIIYVSRGEAEKGVENVR